MMSWTLCNHRSIPSNHLPEGIIEHENCRSTSPAACDLFIPWGGWLGAASQHPSLRGELQLNLGTVCLAFFANTLLNGSNACGHFAWWDVWPWPEVFVGHTLTTGSGRQNASARAGNTHFVPGWVINTDKGSLGALAAVNGVPTPCEWPDWTDCGSISSRYGTGIEWVKPSPDDRTVTGAVDGNTAQYACSADCPFCYQPQTGRNLVRKTETPLPSGIPMWRSNTGDPLGLIYLMGSAILRNTRSAVSSAPTSLDNGLKGLWLLAR